MQDTSQITNWDAIKAGGEYDVETRVTIGNTVYSGFDGTSGIWEIKRISSLTNTLEIGRCADSRLELTLVNPSSIPRMAEIAVEIRLKNDTLTSGWLPKGTFFIDTRVVDGDFLRITAYDAMLKTEQDYVQSGSQVAEEYTVWRLASASVDDGSVTGATFTRLYTNKETATNAPVAGDYLSLADGVAKVSTVESDTVTWIADTSFDYPTNWPQPDVLIVGAIAKRIGVPIDAQTLAVLTSGYDIGFPGYGDGAYTMREVLGFIGVMYGGNWCINDAGALRMISTVNDALWLGDALKFSSSAPFTIATTRNLKLWNGVMEWTDGHHGWREWNGSEIASGEDHAIYIRGVQNTFVTTDSISGARGAPWIITGTNVSCNGYIDALLDWATVRRGSNPIMADNAFAGWLGGCAALIQAPSFKNRTLAAYCYFGAFQACTNLKRIPNLPATQLAEGCYAQMFTGCKKAVSTNVYLPATSFAAYCCYAMFKNCTMLQSAFAMYGSTFNKRVGEYAFYEMYAGCTALKVVPGLYPKALGAYCYSRMFYGCTALIINTVASSAAPIDFRIPHSGTGIDERNNALTDMLTNTGGSVQGTPQLNTTYYAKVIY